MPNSPVVFMKVFFKLLKVEAKNAITFENKNMKIMNSYFYEFVFIVFSTF